MAYQHNASNIVYDHICEKIRDKTWQTGDRISTEMELCEHLGVSRIAVRQAIEKLATQSVLRKVQGSGTYVMDGDPFVLISVPAFDLTPQDLLDIYRFRAGFDSNNAKYFIQNATEEEYAELSRIHEKMLKCPRDSEKLFLYDFRFHATVAKGTHNALIANINQSISASLVKQQQQSFFIVGADTAMEYHPMIYKSLLEKDVELSCMLIQRHIEEAIERLETYFTANNLI